MKPLLDEYVRVSGDCPCPVCGRPDWCLVRHDGKAAICTRSVSDKPRGSAGWFHGADTVGPVAVSAEKQTKLTSSQVRDYTLSLPPVFGHDAEEIGLPMASLSALWARSCGAKRAVFFPMQDGVGNFTGGRFRRANGDKWSLKGGTEGIFAPAPTNRAPSYVAVTEGPTDTAAAISCGINAIGRPNCSGGAVAIKRYLSDSCVPVVILSDPDKPGIRGSKKLAARLPNPCVILVGPTDVRDFVRYHWTIQVRECMIQGLSGRQSPWTIAYRSMNCTPMDLEPAICELQHYRDN